MTTQDTEVPEEIYMDITDIFPFKFYALTFGLLGGFLIYY